MLQSKRCRGRPASDGLGPEDGSSKPNIQSPQSVFHCQHKSLSRGLFSPFEREKKIDASPSKCQGNPPFFSFSLADPILNVVSSPRAPPRSSFLPTNDACPREAGEIAKKDVRSYLGWASRPQGPSGPVRARQGPPWSHGQKWEPSWPCRRQNFSHFFLRHADVSVLSTTGCLGRSGTKNYNRNEVCANNFTWNFVDERADGDDVEVVFHHGGHFQ